MDELECIKSLLVEFFADRMEDILDEDNGEKTLDSMLNTMLLVRL